MEPIEITGAREHNLKDIDVILPRNELVVITGLSGSGKSSLAFDTLFAEGQRRYMETFSAYARQFIGSMERPDVDRITGLSPVISIEQKTTHANPRSTVGTITEIYDFMRVLFARASEAISYHTGEKMVRYSEDEIIQLLLREYQGSNVFLLAPTVKGRKGHYRELFEGFIRQGFLQARIDGLITDLKRNLQLDRYVTHDIELVVDKLRISDDAVQRLRDSVSLAFKFGKGSLGIGLAGEAAFSKGRTSLFSQVSGEGMRVFSRNLVCPSTGISYDDPAPNNFSFNSPYGACETCSGLGTVHQADIRKIIPDDSLSLSEGAILPLKNSKDKWIYKQMELIAIAFKFKMTTPVREIPSQAIRIILYGSGGEFETGTIGFSTAVPFEGVLPFITRVTEENDNLFGHWASAFMHTVSCPDCKGMRLKKESLHFKVDGKNISEFSEMDLSVLYEWIDGIEERMPPRHALIAAEPLKEIRARIRFLIEVGLDYLSLNRPTQSLSGGESQRIRLATQIGSELVGVLYILDEPSIGLHQRDNERLIKSLQKLRDLGNSVLVVEHDKQMILSADYVLDLGPLAGRHGGKVVAAGTPSQILDSGSLTADYLSGKKQIAVPQARRKGNGHFISLENCTGHNLKGVDVSFPLGTFICVTGVSGGGKSSLIKETLFPVMMNQLHGSKYPSLPFGKIKGLEKIDKVIEIDQAPIGRTPRSNPATYTGVFTDIRGLFAKLPESQIRGYQPGRFSFNVKGGRCETCMGGGMRLIEMNFLPDVYVHCEECSGRRYNRETLEVRYKGKSINDVLSMSIENACDFFSNIPSILNRLKTIQEVGLGYITLGQSSTTLSGGEAQRVKLAAELSKRDTGNTFYILDEPTTGLHFEDIRILLDVLNRLVEKGNTILVIEHNLDVIKVADYVIDLGPEGGRRGGKIVCTGTPEEIASHAGSVTGKFLKEELR